MAPPVSNLIMSIAPKKAIITVVAVVMKDAVDLLMSVSPFFVVPDFLKESFLRDDKEKIGAYPHAKA
jgi:hypothetical protein